MAEPIISPEIYRDIIRPIENELSEREGGIEYWHSCGNKDRMMEWIRKLPYCKLWHISPWSDCKIAAEMYSREQALQVCMHPLRDVLNASNSEMEKQIIQIVFTLEKHLFFIDVDAFQVYTSMPRQIKKIQDWIRIAHNVIEKHLA